jgi:propanediol utilization protein
MADMSIIFEASGRLIHVTREHLDILIGKDYELDQKKMLSQPALFASRAKAP